MVQPHVVPVDGIGAKAHMVDAHQRPHVLEVLHEGLDPVHRVVAGERRVRRRLDSDHPAAGRARLEHLVGRQPVRLPEGARADVGEHDGMLAPLDGVQSRPVSAMRAVDQHPQLVHAPDRAPPEHGQPAIARLLQPRAQRIGLAVGDPERPHPEAEEQINAVQLVLDHGRALHRRDPRHPALPVRPQDVVHPQAMDQEVLVRQVAQPHPEVVQHVVPLPAPVRLDGADAVQEVVEDRVPARVPQPLDRGRHAPGAHVRRRLADIPRKNARVLVQRNHDELRGEPRGAGLLLPGERHQVRLDPPDLRRQLEGRVVDSGFEVGEGPVFVVRLVGAHARSREVVGSSAPRAHNMEPRATGGQLLPTRRPKAYFKRAQRTSPSARVPTPARRPAPHATPPPGSPPK